MKYSFPKEQMTQFSVNKAQRQLQIWMDSQGVDAVIITSQDRFLSEYTPGPDNQRQLLTGFKGSTGDGLFLSSALMQSLGVSAPFVLFVDGRYHLQADLETNKTEVSVVKLSGAESISSGLFQWVSKLPEKSKIGFDASRVTYRFISDLQKVAELKSLDLFVDEQGKISQAIGLPGWQTHRPVVALPEEVTGRSLVRNLADIQRELGELGSQSDTVFFTCGADDAAWLFNARGYHMPYQSSFQAYCFTLANKAVLFFPEGVHECTVELLGQDSGVELEIVRGSLPSLFSVLEKWKGVRHLAFHAGAMNGLLPSLAKKIWPEAHVYANFKGLVNLRAVKTAEEAASLRDSYLKSSLAIARTARWAKQEYMRQKISEWDLAQKIAEEYEKEGAVELSFNTIAGTGANGAIIHYGAANKETLLKKGDITLLDSGAYYDAGYATDCTRAWFCGGGTQKPEKWQKEIYTVTLKAWVAGMTAKFPRGMSGIDIDALVRKPLAERGYDYGHGTGHGIGIHVHEEGIRISKVSEWPMQVGRAVSMEPGLYLEGKGGVRIENVVIVKEVEAGEAEGCCFENLIWVGMDWDLIDLTLLTDSEKGYLKSYEHQCREYGTQITECPL